MREQLQKIVIPCCKSFEFIHLKDIVRCEGLQNYTRIFLTNGEQLISSCNIGSFKKILAEEGFFCCHKSHLINEEKISRFHKDGNIELEDSSKVPLSRRRREEFFSNIIHKLNIMTDDKITEPKIH